MINSNFEIGWMVYFIPANTLIHAIVDDLKANKHKINLIQDQTIHFMQILLTFAAYIDFLNK